MHRSFLEVIRRLTVRPDGTARFHRINVVLIGLIVLAVGVVPAFAVTGTPKDSTTSSTTASTAAKSAAPVLVGNPTTSTTAAATSATAPTATQTQATPTTVASAPTTTPPTAASAPPTTTPATPATTTPASSAPAPTEADIVEGDLPTSAVGYREASVSAQGNVPNPGWPKECNAKIGLVLDRSSSIGDPAYGGNFQNTEAVKKAAYSFIDALGGKKDGPRLYINAFATNVRPVYQLWGGGFADIPAETNAFTGGSATKARASVGFTPFASPPTVGYDSYGSRPAPGVGRGRTNWQGALANVPGGANLIIIVTDGEPTWWNGANPATNNGATQPDDVANAISEANRIKRAGTRIVAVHVGQTRSGRSSLVGISGPVEGTDYFYSGYAGLDSTLRQIASRSCPKPPPPAKTNKITIEKTADKNAARPGDKVTYSFKVTNDGDETLAPVVVTDNVLGSIGTVASLAPDASKTLTKEYTVPATQTANVVNTATATGTTPGGKTVKDTDDHTLSVLTLKVEKSADKPSANQGETVVYSFKVTNTSAVTLNNIAVEDDVLGTIGTIESLAAGASQTLTKSFVVPAGSGPIVNTVTACALVPGSTTDKVCGEDNHTLPRISIGLTKTASVQIAGPGETITYTYIVTNTSGVKLTNLALTDDKLGKITLPVTELAAGASTTATAQYVVKTSDSAPANPSGQIVNIATVAGTDPNGTEVTAEAKATVGVVAGTVATTTPPTTTPTPEVKGESLAFTGAGTTSLVTVALMLLTMGTAILLLTKVRRRLTTDGRRA
jgi:uncharacterized repeat protein (TIGR01451 family)